MAGRLKEFGQLLSRSVTNSLGKAAHKLINEWEVHRKVAQQARFAAGAVGGAGLALAGKGTSKFKEHVWSKNQFDKLIWLGLFYYGMQWVYHLFLKEPVFRELPLNWTMLNVVIAIVVLLFFFKPSLKSFVGGFTIIMFYTAIMESYYRIDLAFIPGGDLGTIISLLAITILIGLVWRHFLHEDISGMMGVAITFLLETGFKFYIVAQILPFNATAAGFLLFLPYWTILGIVAGSYVEGGASKLAGFARFILIGWILVVFAFGLLFGESAFGTEKISISEQQQAEATDAFLESTEKGVNVFRKVFAPITCSLDPLNYQDCILEKTAPPPRELTEEEKYLAVVNSGKDPRLSLQFSNVPQYFDEGEDITISTILIAESNIIDEEKEIFFFCSIKERDKDIAASIAEPIDEDEQVSKVTLQRNSKNSWDVDCKADKELKSGRKDVEFLAKWRQFTTTSLASYFMAENRINKINSLYEIENPQYKVQLEQCQYFEDGAECRNNLQTSLYSQLEEFQDIQTDPVGNAKFDNEVASVIIRNTHPETVIGVSSHGEEFSLRFWVKNNRRNGEIVEVNSIQLLIPKGIEKTGNCEILDDKNFVKKEILEAIDWTSVKEDKIIPGRCEFKINKVDSLTRMEFRADMDFDYQLVNDMKITVRKKVQVE